MSSRLIHVLHIVVCPFQSGQIVAHCMYTPHFLYLLSINGHLSCCHILTIVNSAVMNIAVLVAEILISIVLDIDQQLSCLWHEQQNKISQTNYIKQKGFCMQRKQSTQ